MDFMGIGPVEMLMVVFVAFLILGPARMVEGARSLGKFMQEINRVTSDLANVISIEQDPLDEEPDPSRPMGRGKSFEENAYEREDGSK